VKPYYLDATMTELHQLLQTIKKHLKLQGKTYRDLAAALDLSEASVKRLFRSDGGHSISAERLLQVSHYLGFSLLELAQEADAISIRLHTLSHAQEKELVSEPKLLLVAVCALNHWTMADILAVYKLSETECLQKLLRLDKLQLISLLPGNRIRLNIARDFDWLDNGPIRNYFIEVGMPDFLNAKFNQDDESLSFIHGMLTDAATAKLHAELRQLKRKFAELHAESLSAPLAKRNGTALLLAMRWWEPMSFVELRRERMLAVK
jgi:transcriptional regulator with XRE-family HTH domain